MAGSRPPQGATPVSRESLIPYASFCYGREALTRAVIDGLRTSQAALLFGGRLAGKTTLLLKVHEQLRRVVKADELDRYDLPIYVNLMDLAADAGPEQFFALVFSKAADACALDVQGWTRQGYHETFRLEAMGFSAFIQGLSALRKAAGAVDLGFVFLLDESKRIFSSRFPRGLQDNLFSLLFSPGTELEGAVSIVFAGAQDLYDFSEDDTSPIGSRASRHFISNLDQDAIRSLTEEVWGKLGGAARPQFSEWVSEQTGGHAGLARFIAVAATRLDIDDFREGWEQQLRRKLWEKAALFKIWNSSLSPPAAAIRDQLLVSRTISTSAAADLLATRNLDRFMADRAFEELSFTGVGHRTEELIDTSCVVFWDYISQFGQGTEVGVEQGVWALIEATELELRQLVFNAYIGAWPGTWSEEMKGVLGKEAWDQLLERERRRETKYPMSESLTDSKLIDFTYIGQLQSLMLSRKSWHLFSRAFRDKRQAEDMFGCITPVRNDRAHFNHVPGKEIERCRIACDDLLRILEQLKHRPTE